MKRITISVDLDATVPDDLDDFDIGAITLEIPYEQIRIDSTDGPIKGASVTGYCTQDVQLNG